MVKQMFLIGLILTTSLLWPLFTAPYFTHHDDVQVIRIYEMHQCIKDLQIPCRWVPHLGGLYGYPLFNFYAPLPYYVGEIVYLLTGSLLLAAKALFAISLLGAFVLMFYLGRKLWGDLGGLISGVFYSFAPYHGVDLYVRGAVGELWALMFFPGILWALIKLYEAPQIKNVLLLGLMLALMVTSHNLSAMIFLPVVAIVALVLFWMKRQPRFLIGVGQALIVGLLLSSFYWLPMLVEKNLVHVDTTTYGYFSYTEHFKGFKKLFLERFWGWGSSIREIPGGEKEQISFQIGIVHLIVWLLALWVGWRLWRRDRNKAVWIGLSTLMILVSVFMINPRSEFIWRLVSPLKYLQFPWRLLMLTILFISLSAGAVVLLSKKWTKLVVGVLIAAVVVANFGYFRPEHFLDLSEQDLLSGERWDRQIKRSIFDYLPIYAKAPPAQLAPQRYEIITGQSEIKDFQEGSNVIRFKTDTKALTIIRLSQYYFPDWKVRVDGREVEINPRNELGLITFAIDPGQHQVVAKLYDTQIRTVANLVSLIGIVGFVILTLWQFKKPRRFLLYLFHGFR